MTGQRTASEPSVLTDIALEIDPAEVLRFQGYKRDADLPSAEVRRLFDEALALGRALMEPRAVVCWLAVTRQDRDLLEASGAALRIPEIRQRWGAVEQVIASPSSGRLASSRSPRCSTASARAPSRASRST